MVNVDLELDYLYLFESEEKVKWSILWSQKGGRYHLALDKVLMVLWCTLRVTVSEKGKVNGLTPEDLISRALHCKGLIGFTEISGTAISDEYFVFKTFILYEFYWN